MIKLEVKLDIENIELLSQTADNLGDIILKVNSTKQETKCKNCGQKATKKYGNAPEIKIRHLSILDTPTYIIIQPVRYKCEHCDNVTTEEYDWCDQRSKTTKALDRYIPNLQIDRLEVEPIDGSEHSVIVRLEYTVKNNTFTESDFVTIEL